MEGFECFAVSSLEKVFADAQPMMEEKENVCFANEVFSFQIAYCNHGQDPILKRGSWEIESTLREFIRVRPVYGVPCTLPYGYVSDDYYLVKTAKLVPDLLAEEDFFGIRIGQWGALWVTVSGNLPCGKHTVRIVLKVNGEKAGEAEYTLTVLAKKLPESDLRYAHWMHYDCISQKHNALPGGKKFEKIVARYLKNAAAHGTNVCFVPLFTPPLNTAVGSYRQCVQLVDVKAECGHWTFDYGRVLKFMRLAQRCGMKYFEMSHLFTQWGAEHPPLIMAEKDGARERVFGWQDDSLGKDYVSFLREFLTTFVRFLRENGYEEDRVVFHISDEPNCNHLKRYLRLRTIVKECLGEYKVLDALSDYEFYAKGGVDIPVSTTDHAPVFLKNGVRDLWVYYCCGQGGEYLSNRFMAMPLQRTRILGYQLYLAGCKGFLHWGYNFYNSALSERGIDPYLVTDADGSFQSGDSFIVYPGKDGPLDSMRHEAMADAVQDYRMLLLLEKRIGREEVCRFLREEGVRSFTEYPHDAYWQIRVRRKIIEMCRKNDA